MKRISVFLPVLVATCSLLIAFPLSGCETGDTGQPSVIASPGEAPGIVPSTPPQSDMPGDKPAATGRTVTVYSVAEDADGNQTLKPEMVPVPGDFTTTPALFALETLMNTEKSPIPEGTKLRSVKINEDGMATVDFSHELKDNFGGGDSAEALLINSVLSTLGQFKSVKTVQFLIDGKKIDSLGGTQTLDEPLPVPQAKDTAASIPAVATPPFAGNEGR